MFSAIEPGLAVLLGADWRINATAIHSMNSQNAVYLTYTPRVSASAEVDNELTILFVHHQFSKQFRIVGELQDYQSDVQNDYNATILGFQFDF